MAKKEIILGVTGSIAAYRACDIVNGLRKSGLNVTVIMTKEAKEFITPLTLQTLSRNKVYSEMFESPSDWSPVHTSLADMADAILIAPACANVIGKLANGICDDLLTCVVAASSVKVLIAPAMNEKMYSNPAVQDNIKKLKARGVEFIGPVKGPLACGCQGVGHIADSASIVSEVKKAVKG
ncbi:MAG: flavoprotein [Candidatus Omnitrophota bacterium]|jgi:phosphopantothenoylcysteine decarboxylase/phosphopantothenate--cysteine ligase